MSEVRGPCVLLVEDEPVILTVMEMELVDAGFDVVSYTKSKDAIADLEKDASRFSAIVTDIDLGGPPDGWEIGRRARELSPAIVVLYASGRRAVDFPHEGVPDSVMLQKPFAAAQLITALASKLNQNPGSFSEG
jgi:DNA-binding response OmpR family regulator